MSAAEDFAQYKLHFVDDIQHDYEVIRPIVLFAETVAERSRQTGMERTVVGAKARRFATAGMLGLVDQRLGNLGQQDPVYPEAIAAHILYVKQLYPPIHDREIVRIGALGVIAGKCTVSVSITHPDAGRTTTRAGCDCSLALRSVGTLLGGPREHAPRTPRARGRLYFLK